MSKCNIASDFAQRILANLYNFKYKIMLKTIVYGNITSSSGCLLMSKKKGGVL